MSRLPQEDDGVSTNIETFFAALGQRSTNDEVALSDVTYALLSASPLFRARFAAFFEFNLDDAHSWAVQREYPLGNHLHVDLALYRGQEEVYLIENKVRDRHYHFQEYAESEVGRRAKGLALIVGHQVTDPIPVRWSVRMWRDLVEELEREPWNGPDRELIHGYAAYVKEVCTMATVKDIRFDQQSLVSLFYFNNLLDRVIGDFKSDKVQCRRYETKYHFDNGNCGKYIEVVSTEGALTVLPWVGLHLEDPAIGIWFEKDEGWCAPVYNHIPFRQRTGKLYETTWDRDGIWCELQPKHYQAFLAGTPVQQFQILMDLLREVLEDVVQMLATPTVRGTKRK